MHTWVDCWRPGFKHLENSVIIFALFNPFLSSFPRSPNLIPFRSSFAAWKFWKSWKRSSFQVANILADASPPSSVLGLFVLLLFLRQPLALQRRQEVRGGVAFMLFLCTKRNLQLFRGNFALKTDQSRQTLQRWHRRLTETRRDKPQFWFFFSHRQISFPTWGFGKTQSKLYHFVFIALYEQCNGSFICRH